MPFHAHLRALLSKGYFPKELPPVFTTADFGKHAGDIISEWINKKVITVEHKKIDNKTKRRKRDAYLYKIRNAEIEVLSKPKRGYERRNIHITHPVPQALLCLEISKNIRRIQKWLSRQIFSVDEIQISKQYDRSIKGINFGNHRAKKGYIEATSDWLVKTDITRFYPSIYTHSIAWAAYGKERVKNNLNLYNGSLADRLDLLVRACNRNQTIGIPIGPESSRIIAEIISSRIDDDFAKLRHKPGKQQVDRLQDDWFIGVDSLEDAEAVLSTITTVYRDYGLEINGHKTSIDHILKSPGSLWTSEITAFLSHASLQKGSRLRDFFSLILRLQAQYPTDSVINYALSTIENNLSSGIDAEPLESFLLKAAVVSPLSMDTICRIILNVSHNSKKISKDRVRQRFTILAERNLEKGNLFEVVWLVYTLRGLHQPLRSRRIADIISQTAGSTLQLILLDMNSKNLFPCRLPTDQWSSYICDDCVQSDSIWLLAYEGIRHGWLSDPLNVMKSPFFNAMATRNVTFYDSRRSIARSEAVVARRRLSSRTQSAAMKKFMIKLRGIEPLDVADEY